MTPERMELMRRSGLIGMNECLDEIELLQAENKRIASAFSYTISRLKSHHMIRPGIPTLILNAERIKEKGTQ